MEYNELSLTTLYQRAVQVCINKHGVKPDFIRLDYDSLNGVVAARYREDDDEWYVIGVEDLNADLDALVAERLEREKQERLEEVERQNKLRIAREKREREQRYNQYLQLKKEFDQNELLLN